jgi:hypothetical protein
VVGNLYQPTAVWAQDGLHVYYYDASHGTLREASSPSGVTWSSQVIDGQGGFPGGTGDTVGYLPSAIYNSATGNIDVFYTDKQASKLRLAQRSMGIWSFAVVDDIDVQSAKAPVVDKGRLEVYYTSKADQVRVAYWTPALNLAAIDGLGAGDLTGPWSLQDSMAPGSLTGIEVNNVGPSIFYLDNSPAKPANFGMRNAYWK